MGGGIDNLNMTEINSKIPVFSLKERQVKCASLIPEGSEKVRPWNEEGTGSIAEGYLCRGYFSSLPQLLGRKLSLSVFKVKFPESCGT